MSKTKPINFLTNATERLIKFQITVHIFILLVIKLQCQLDSQPCQISYSECQGILGGNSRSQRIVLGLKVRFGIIRASQPLSPTWISIVTWRTSYFSFDESIPSLSCRHHTLFKYLVISSQFSLCAPPLQGLHCFQTYDWSQISTHPRKLSCMKIIIAGLCSFISTKIWSLYVVMDS